MEEADIELWYEEKKQQLSELYIKSIEKGMDVHAREVKFTKAMDKLNRQYEKKHTSYLRMVERKKSRSAFFAAFWSPFHATGSGVLSAARFIGHGISGAFSQNYAQVHFSANLVRIRHSYKIPDGLATSFRPVYYFYAMHLKLPLLIVTGPFTRFFRSAKQGFIQIGEGISKAALAIWKGIKIAAKSTAVHMIAAHKKIAAKMADISKRHQEWQAKRVQAHLDKKTAKQNAAAQEKEKLETV